MSWKRAALWRAQVLTTLRGAVVGNMTEDRTNRGKVLGLVQFSSVQSLSRIQLFATPWTSACQASLSITNSWSLLKLMSIELVMPSNCLILCHPLLLLPLIFPSIRVFSDVSALHIRWPVGASALASFLPVNIQGWFLLGFIGLISLLSKGLTRVFFNTIWNHQFFGAQVALWSNSHICTWLLEKP